MSREALVSINEAEEAARKAKAAAVAEGRKLVSDAEKAGAASVETARKQAEEETAQLISKTEQTALKEAGELARTTENKKAVTKAAVEKRLGAAADYIVGRIVTG